MNSAAFSFSAGLNSSGYMAPPAKRKRYTLGGSSDADAVPASTIEDPRIPQAQALRLNSPFITILVGPPGAEESFHVHEDVICDRSPFFKSAMREEWASQREDPRVIELPDDEPMAFSRLPVYQSYLYTGRLPILPEDSSPSPPPVNVATSRSSSARPLPWLVSPLQQHTCGLRNHPPQANPQPKDPEEHPHPSITLPLAHAFILGDRLLDTRFKNLITSTYVLFARGTPPGRRLYPSNEEIALLYHGTTSGAPIRKLLIDIWCARGKAEWMTKELDEDPEAELPREFLWDVTRGLLALRGNIEERRSGGERYEGLVSRPWKERHAQYLEKEG